MEMWPMMVERRALNGDAMSSMKVRHKLELIFTVARKLTWPLLWVANGARWVSEPAFNGPVPSPSCFGFPACVPASLCLT